MANHSYLDGLNDAQREAVLHTEGPLLVLAGAGSGKTRVITHRIAHLIEKGAAPNHILAVTFTNKAATEMRERVRTLLQARASTARAEMDTEPTVTTFHALGVRILREHHATLDLPRHFTIFDRSDSSKAMKQAVEKAGYDPKEFEPRKLLSIISRAKGDGEGRLEFLDRATSYRERVAAEVWEHYDMALREAKALDFDDLLLKTYRLLNSYPNVREVLQDRFRYLHIDEYQDTNAVQFKIIELLAGENKNLCVVGDVDQNIYSWRGADIKNVMQFERNFPGARTVFLEENYRSTKTIIEVSNQVIAENVARIPKTVFTNNDIGEKITLHASLTAGEEADYIAYTSQQLIKGGVSPSHIAILYRTNFQSRVLEEAFLNYEVPYQLLGTKFFERKEVKDVLSYIRLALNPGSTNDLARIINVPTRGIGKVTVLKILGGERQSLKGAIDTKVKAFETMLDEMTLVLKTKPVSEGIKFILKRSGIEADLRKDGLEDDLERLENLRELVTLATRYDELGPEASAEALLENAALQSDQDELHQKEQRDAVRLMTIHAAKGLEFPYVFITGLEEGLFPHERLDDTGVDMEEERRLFYVALTRAEQKVYLTYAHTRMIFGSERVNMPSSFLNGLSEEHVEASARNGEGEARSGFERTIYLD